MSHLADALINFLIIFVGVTFSHPRVFHPDITCVCLIPSPASSLLFLSLSLSVSSTCRYDVNYKKDVLCEQKGVFRVNCMDCLDRTNVVQSVIAREVIQTAVSINV